jgi:hypothetical protein
MCKNNVSRFPQGSLPGLDDHRAAHGLVIQFAPIRRGGADGAHHCIRA